MMHSLRWPEAGLLAILLFLTLVAPFLDLPFSRRLRRKATAEGRLAFYRFATVQLWLLAAVCWRLRDGAGLRVSHAPGDLSWVFGAPWRTWLAAVPVGVFLVLVLMPGIACVLQPRRVPAYTRAAKRMHWLLPQGDHQRRWWVLVSVTAGVCEEWIFRGYVLHGLHAEMGFSLTMALVLSSALFGWNHLYQGWSAIGGSTLIGFALGLVALLTGGLLIPMGLHAVIDLQVLVSFRPHAEICDAASEACG